MKKKLIITTIIVVIIVVVVLVSIYAFKKTKPGVYFPYRECKAGSGDEKIYGDNWKARGAVCEGLYIPIGTNLQGQDTTKVLEWMMEIYSYKGTPTEWDVTKNITTRPFSKDSMKELAEAAAYQAKQHP